MENIIQKITPAIITSCKILVELSDGKNLIVNPHIVIKKKQGDEILKSMLDSGDCLDIPLHSILTISLLPESFAIDSTCLNFDYEEYEIVFPKKADWFE